MRRDASHAGSWYTADAQQLDEELDDYLKNAAQEAQEGLPIKGVRAIIGPHAGFRYSGPTAAFAYKSIDTTNIKRVFILGPSHHAYLPGCALSMCDVYQTPLGDLHLDKAVIKELEETGEFKYMRQTVDEDEHSIEMHLPFVYKIFENTANLKVVPILVGATSQATEKRYGELLAKYLENPENFFIISSDFCHWGARFRYTYYTKSSEDNRPLFLTSANKSEIERPIYQSIEELDHQAIDVLEDVSFSKFQEYLKATDNTICGRHPISVLLAALEKLRVKDEFSNQTLKCMRYEQSSRCKRYEDSSVSYASIYVKILAPES
ncbi:MEMO1 family [Mycotypha africana]|uniref:MEMO1 family n=1 Tax=Mycotypha africana TaxID=64632 RepID=UPI0023003A55|nr:MEMO1 family [Mycotypha africana]KAI8970014.1 MEMO1 family [Mycotypha africana]